MSFFKKLVVITFTLHYIVLSFVHVSAQAETLMPGVSTGNYNALSGPNPDSYFVDDNGNILMIVNVMGEVGSPGQVTVPENADIPSIISRAGGFTSTANLKKVLIARYRPDDNGKLAYKLNLKPYYDEGDRTSFMALKPNDTIIVPGKKGITIDSIFRIAGTVVSGYAIYSLFTNMK